MGLKHKQGTAAAATAANETLESGELGFETDTKKWKVGDGVTAWNSLAYLTLGPGAQPLDADLTTIAGLTATTDNIIQSVAGAWASRTPAQVKTALAIAESDVTNLTTDLAAKQPLDSDLTTIAGLTATTDNMIQSVGSAWASRTPAQVKTALAIAESDVTSLVADLAAKAPLASPTLTGTVTLPTGLTGPLRADAGVVSTGYRANLGATTVSINGGGGTGDQTIWTPANVAAGALVAGQTRFHAFYGGDFDNVATSGAINTRLKVNGTTVSLVPLAPSQTGAATVTTWTIYAEVFIDITGAVGKVTVISTPFVVTAAGGGRNTFPVVTSTTSLNLTAGCQFTLIGQFATGNAGNIIRTFRASIDQGQ